MNHTFTNCPSRGKRNTKTGALLCPKCWMEEYYYDQKVLDNKLFSQDCKSDATPMLHEWSAQVTMANGKISKVS